MSLSSSWAWIISCPVAFLSQPSDPTVPLKADLNVVDPPADICLTQRLHTSLAPNCGHPSLPFYLLDIPD